MGVIRRVFVLLSLLSVVVLPGRAQAQGAFVNWENPHVHPLDMTPDGTKLLAVNTADNRLLVFNVSGQTPTLAASIPVGLDPVSVRARSNTEAWVVNHISDSVSIVNLLTGNVVRTIPTDDEPADVVFAGSPQRAFITCSQVNRVLVVDPANPLAPPVRIPLLGEDPRALAVSADGSKVYAAIFESGNASTVLVGGLEIPGFSIPNVVSDPAGPYGGINPPPNAGSSFYPPLNSKNPPPLAVSHIVKKDALGRWMDDNGADWTDLVSGPNASRSGRPVGWDVVDNDVAIIDTATFAVTYAKGLMNINMALAVHPTTGRITVVGTDATNEVRFEPVLNGRFLRVLMAEVDPLRPAQKRLLDLNPHLTYSTPTIPEAQRELSVGDPRGIVWNASGTSAYVTGMGSNNVVVLNGTGSAVARIDVGEGPTGVKLDEARGKLYVLNKFEGSLSVVSLRHQRETARLPFFDPTPTVIKAGRKHLYDTQKSSGLGHISCASCHVDARMDKLAWDLGDPAGEMKSIAGKNLAMGSAPIIAAGPAFQDWHPMKGPMTTQTLQDIIGKEPLHWRGDRDGLEEFNPAFMGLQGDDAMLTPVEMQQFKDFLATLTFPPNPFRNLDNTLATDVPLPGHFTTDRFGPAGRPLPNGNAARGLELFRPPRMLVGGAIACATCHTLPTGMAPDMTWDGSRYVPMPLGPNGEHAHGLTNTDGHTNVTFKVPQFRNLYEKVGMELSQTSNLSGFGFNHNGIVDSLARFITAPPFSPANDQEVADLVAFLLSFSGSDLPRGSADDFLQPPGPFSRDSHAAVGKQVTLAGAPTFAQRAMLDSFQFMADAGRVGLVAKGRVNGVTRGFTYVGYGIFQTDRSADVIGAQVLEGMAAPGSELTFTVVPAGTEWRIGVDQDLDGELDRDELDRGSDPASPKRPRGKK
jgi:YVTN family beta-propeller protein